MTHKHKVWDDYMDIRNDLVRRYSVTPAEINSIINGNSITTAAEALEELCAKIEKKIRDEYELEESL